MNDLNRSKRIAKNLRFLIYPQLVMLIISLYVSMIIAIYESGCVEIEISFLKNITL